jgi:hypothetical protein
VASTSLEGNKVLASRVMDLDFDEISKWFELRKMESPEKHFFPKIGFIVHGYAAGFLYLTDSLVGIIDCYISNPKSVRLLRDKALDLVTEELIKSAKFHGCKVILCDSHIESIKDRASKHGFESNGVRESFMMRV